jgi:outer membrane protein insertion porin family
MLKKISCLVIAALLLNFVPCSYAAASDIVRIKKIEFNGLENVKSGKVSDVIKSKKGKAYSETIARQDVRNILELSSFDDVQINFDKLTGLLTFSVKEKPFITKITFKGNKNISSGKLKGESVLKEKEFFDVFKLDESKAKITTLYRDKGFADVQIEVYPTIDPETNQMTISFLITENNKITIGGITAEGIKVFSPKKVIKQMKTKTGKVFKEDTFRQDLAVIEAYYKNRGYIDYNLKDYQTTFNEERTNMFIHLIIEEGVRYSVGEITFSGNSAIDEKHLRSAVSIKKGQIFNQEKLVETLQAVYELYSDKGYLNAQLDPQFIKGSELGVVDIAVSVVENTVVYVGNIYIDGLVNTKEKTIRREILLKEGDVLSGVKVRRSMERIYNLGFIDGAEPKIQPTGTFNVMDLAFDITEGKPGMVTAGAGYSSVDQFVGSLQFQHMNMFGLANRLNALWEFGARRQNYQLDWTDPWFLDKNMSLTLSAYDMTRVREYNPDNSSIGTITDAYDENRMGAGVRLGPRISDRVGLLFGYSYEHVNLYDIDERIPAEEVESWDIQRSRTSSVMAQITYDTRDYVFDPTRGQRQLLSTQVAGGPFGGNVNFVKTIAKSTWFFPTFWKFVLSFNLHAGYVTPYGSGFDDVPIYERFFVGGADTVRGYDYRTQIGPANGGNYMFVFNAEYKFPIVQQKGRPLLQGAFFYDLGGTWETWQELKQNFHLGTDRTNLKSGVGFGIRVATPVFPLRLDWGYGLNHKEGDRLQQFYFTIGNVF